MNKYFFTILISLFAFSTINSQVEINQFDEQGKRDGVWKKTYENSDQIRYEGAFSHGKEIGTFKFYCSDCKSNPTMIKTFNENDDQAKIVYLTSNGKIISEGTMKGKLRIGEWTY